MIDLQNETKAWEPRQIAKRAEAMVRSQFSVAEELILSRKLQGVAQGAYTLSSEEEAQVAAFQATTLAAQAAGVQAAADNTLLVDVLAYEQAQRRLARYRLADGLSGGWSDTGGEVVVGAFVRMSGGDIGEVARLYQEADVGEVAEVSLTGDIAVTELPADLVSVQWVEPIEPLQATVESVDEQGVVTAVPNPAIVHDDAERAQAQAVIGGASQAVIDLVEVRANAS